MDDLFISVKLLYYLSRLFGLSCYVPSKVNGERVFKKNLFSVQYGCVFITCHGLCSIILYNYFYKYRNFEIILRIVFRLQVNGLIFYFFTLLHMHIYKSSEFVIILNQLFTCDEQLKLLGISVDYKYVYKYTIKIIILEFIFYSLIFIFVKLELNQLFYIIIHFVEIWVRLIFLLYFEIFIIFLQQRYLALNKNLHRYIYYITHESSREHSYSHLSQLCTKTAKIHRNLHKIFQNVNDVFSFNLLVYFSLIFTIQLTHIYSIASKIINFEIVTDFDQLISSLYWITYYMVQAYIVIFLCSRLAKDVSYIALVVLNKISLIFLNRIYCLG